MKYRSIKNRLLLAAPEGPVRERYQTLLENAQYVVLTADTGQKSLRVLRDHLMDGIILDYRTPFSKNGAENYQSKTLETITDAAPLLPLILTYHPDTELGHAEQLMADMVLPEPVDKETLLAAFDTVLQESLRERALRKAGSIAVFR